MPLNLFKEIQSRSEGGEGWMAPPQHSFLWHVPPYTLSRFMGLICRQRSTELYPSSGHTDTTHKTRTFHPLGEAIVRPLLKNPPPIQVGSNQNQTDSHAKVQSRVAEGVHNEFSSSTSWECVGGIMLLVDDNCWIHCVVLLLYFFVCRRRMGRSFKCLHLLLSLAKSFI